MKKRIENLPNIYTPNKNEISLALFKRKINLEEIPEMTLVYRQTKFETIRYEKDREVEDNGMYYIQKYKKIATADELYDFVAGRPEEKFLMLEDGHGQRTDVYAFLDSKPYDIRLYFFNNAEGLGQFKMIAKLKNKYGTAEWEKPEILDKQILSFEHEKNYYGREENHLTMKFATGKKDQVSSTATYIPFNIEGGPYNTENYIVRWLQLPGQTRLYAKLEYGSSINYSVAIGPDAVDTPLKRHGLKSSEAGWRESRFHEEEVFPKAELDPDTWERVKNKIIKTLQDGMGTARRIGRWSSTESLMYVKSMTVISAPVDGHRRPTFHLIKGFMHGGAIDVVELARGELLMKDMTPVNCYYLNADTGEYSHISHTLFGEVKQEIMNESEVDRVSFMEWNEEKSLHPELLAAIAACGADKRIDKRIDLEKIKLFNRIRFGALFAEHLIKGGNDRLAVSFAEYIAERADNMNYRCGSLEDVLPNSNPDGTSLIKVLNMTKLCYDLLFEKPINDINTLIVRYSAIKHVAPDGVLTKERTRLITQYLELVELKWATYNCGTGRTVDIIEHPEEIKSIYKMINKIKNAYHENSYEPLRHYKEIVEAYFQFKDFGWSPAESMIFIEFGIDATHPNETMQMLNDREHAANTALSIYKDKIDEIVREKCEKKYAYRKRHAIRKLESTKELEKTSELFKRKYVVIAPSQIYGEDIIGSVEKEGHDMNHCVFRSYAGQISEGTYTVLYLRDKNSPEESLVTIGITREGRINQTFTFNDRGINETQATAIVEWAKSKKGLVTFKSEHADVRPGGWEYNVPIPNLPEPSKDWLEKLASTNE